MDSDRTSPPSGPAFEAFVALIARLRAPGGCPWDREQTHASLKPMTLEEAYEVAGHRPGRRPGVGWRARRPPAAGRLPLPDRSGDGTLRRGRRHRPREREDGAPPPARFRRRAG